jgi:hypothetical protein
VLTTTLVLHLDRDTLDRLCEQGSVEVEVFDSEQPGQMPVGTMLVVADIEPEPEPVHTETCPEHGEREVLSTRRVGHWSDPYQAVRLDCGHEVVDVGDGPGII